MKQLLLLYTTAYSETADYGRRIALIQSRLADEYHVRRAALLDLEYRIKGNKLQIVTTDDLDLATLDAVFFARWHAYQCAMAVAYYLDRHQVAYKPRQVREFPPIDKLGEHALLAGGEVPLINTVITSVSNIKRHTYRYIQDFHEPTVLKKVDASMGNCNFLLHRYNDIFKCLANYKDTDMFMVQPFIPNHEDYRVLVFNGQAKVVLRRTRDGNGTHLNNTKQGAKGELVPMTPELQHLAETAARLTGRTDLAGVDIIFDENTGQSYVLEVNKMPVLINYPIKDDKLDALIDFIRSI